MAEKFSDDPLTPRENVEFRRMLDADQKARWFWTTMRTWAIWITAVAGGLTIGWDFMAKIVKRLAGA